MCSESNGHACWTDLTAFEGNVLYAVVCLQTNDETSYGLAIKRVLEDFYDKEINHGRVYPTLDDLAEYGLVKKSTIDERTNEYEVTDVGRELLRQRANLLAEALDEGVYE